MLKSISQGTVDADDEKFLQKLYSVANLIPFQLRCLSLKARNSSIFVTFQLSLQSVDKIIVRAIDFSMTLLCFF